MHDNVDLAIRNALLFQGIHLLDIPCKTSDVNCLADFY